MIVMRWRQLVLPHKKTFMHTHLNRYTVVYYTEIKNASRLALKVILLNTKSIFGVVFIMVGDRSFCFDWPQGMNRES